MRSIKIILGLLSILILISCHKMSPEALDFQLKSNRISKMWKLDKAFASTSSANAENGEDVTHAWERLTFECWDYGVYRQIDYSPDSLVTSIKSGKWQLNTIDELFLQGTDLLIEFSSGDIVEENQDDETWMINKLEEDELWIWSETSIYAQKGILLRFIPA